MKSADRKEAMKLLGLKQTSTIDDFLEFLHTPHDSGKKLPAPKKRAARTPSKATTTPSKRKRSSKSGTPSKKKAKLSTKLGTDDECQSDNSLSISDEEEEIERIVQSNLLPKKRRVSDAEVNEVKSGPSDEDLVTAIKKIVDDIDIEEVSMKQAVSKVYELYPDEDLSERKSFIKDNIRKLIG